MATAKTKVELQKELDALKASMHKLITKAVEDGEICAEGARNALDELGLPGLPPESGNGYVTITARLEGVQGANERWGWEPNEDCLNDILRLLESAVERVSFPDNVRISSLDVDDYAFQSDN